MHLFSERDPIGRSSPNGCSRSARPPRMPLTTVGRKREHNCDLEERIGAKGIKTEKY
jgi:hypothetical protein